MPTLDTYVEEHSSSWGGRLKNSIAGVGFGFILFLASFGILFWNEGRAVITAKSLEEGKKDVISISSETIDAGNENKLVHTSGQALTQNMLSDSDFGLEFCALHLKRIVEMYQWKEDHKTRKTSDGKTKHEYTYRKVWNENPIASEKFKRPDGHNNPPMPFHSKLWSASDVKVGDFQLNAALVQDIQNFEEIPIIPGLVEKLPDGMKTLKVFENKYYKGNDPLNPQIGDVQIRFEMVKPEVMVSIIAQQTGKTFCPYPTKAGRKLQMLAIGQISAENMFQAALAENATLTWLLRLGGFLAMLFGIMLMLSPFMTLVDVIPIIRDIVGLGVFLISLVISIVFSLVTIAIAWFFYRPVLSIVLIAIAATLILFSRQYSLESKKEAVAE